MKLMKRIRFILEGKAEAVLGRAEDPQEQLAVFVRELDEQLAASQRAVASAIADEKRLKARIDELMSKAQEWERRAVLALEQQDETLAREALLKKEECDAEAEALHKGWAAQRQAVEKLKASLQATRTRAGEAKRRYTLLLAEYRSAETKKKINETLTAQGGESPAAMMEKLSDRIHQLEAEAEAALEVGGDAVGDDLEATFAAIERRKKGDDALAALKDKLSTGAVPA